jgi:hypothetical protein
MASFILRELATRIRQIDVDKDIKKSVHICLIRLIRVAIPAKTRISHIYVIANMQDQG